MQDILTGIGLVLVIEGLVYALAPSLLVRMLEALRSLPDAWVRGIGLGAVTMGVLVLWVARAAG